MTTTVQNYLDKGLRGLWYPVLASWEVQSAPVGITRLGEQIVVWLTDAAGALAAAMQSGKAGGSGTMLTGPSGVDPAALQLGKSTLLGG